MSNTKNTEDLLLFASTEGFLVGANTISSLLRSLTEKSRSYRKTRDITLPITAQFSALVLEQLSLLPSSQLQEIKALLVDWKVKEASQRPWDFSFHPDGRLLTDSEKILQQLADSLITAVSEEHGLAVKVSFKRGRVHGSRDAFGFQVVEQAKTEAVKRIHELTNKVSEMLEADALVIEKAVDVRRDLKQAEGTKGWGSRLFKDFNEKEFEVALCALLLIEKVEIEKDFLGEKKRSLGHSVVKLKEIFKIKDLE
ncbi:hypothetical protein V8E51_012884 [Hyaloscypha variabilis]|jgi:hypothetical protein